MPWTHDNYPASWNQVSPPIRRKAIEIGNALLADGMDKGRAIPIALSQARKALGSSGPADAWVVPHDDGWAFKLEGDERARKTFDTQRAAIDRAVAYARDEEVTVTVQSADGTIRERQSFKQRL